MTISAIAPPGQGTSLSAWAPRLPSSDQRAFRGLIGGKVVREYPNKPPGHPARQRAPDATRGRSWPLQAIHRSKPGAPRLSRSRCGLVDRATFFFLQT